MPHPLILASTSPFRQQQLKELQINFEAIPPLFDEESFKNDNLFSPKDLAENLAKSKALSLKDQCPHSLILGGDQLLDFSGEILGKAGSPEKAVEQLLKLSRKTHQLITSICLVLPDNPPKVLLHTDTTLITLKNIDKETAENYVKKYQTWQSAGSYKYECQPELIIEKVESNDPSSIIGIPTLKLITWLKELNWPS